jgi:hypothetical protein
VDLSLSLLARWVIVASGLFMIVPIACAVAVGITLGRRPRSDAVADLLAPRRRGSRVMAAIREAVLWIVAFLTFSVVAVIAVGMSVPAQNPSAPQRSVEEVASRLTLGLSSGVVLIGGVLFVGYCIINLILSMFGK